MRGGSAVKILLLTADRETARIYSDAAERAGNLRICVRKNTAQVLERLFRDPFDALLSDDASVVRAGIRSCPVQWPPNIFLLVDRPFPDTYFTFPVKTL